MELPHVLYVAGWQRSGTTLLTSLLGGEPGVLAVGELTGVWRAWQLDHSCSCGQSMSVCPLWSQVRNRLAEKHDMSEGALRTYSDWVGSHVRTRYTSRLMGLATCDVTDWPTPLSEYGRLLQDLLISLRRVSGASAVVDSSKLAPQALIYKALPGVRLTTIHMVRDPRAVAFSEMNTRKVDVVDPSVPPPPGSNAIRSALQWTVANASIRRAFRGDGTYTRITYEALVEDPAAIVAEVVGGHAASSMPKGQRHIAVGNPGRLHSDQPIRLDRRWERNLSRGAKLAVMTLTWPERKLGKWPYR